MTHDRGEYRAIRRVLLDGPDFQRLSERARWVFVALKLNLGPSGIDVFYPLALAAQVAAQTGAPVDAIGEAMDELETAGWIAREANVLWLIGHLANDPHVKASDPKHRKSIVRHVGGLPRLGIVRAFIAAHPEFFPASDGPSTSLGWAIEGPSKGLATREPEREPEEEQLVARATPRKDRTTRTARPSGPAALPSPPATPRESWVGRLVDLWQGDVGRIAPGRLGEQLKASVTRHGVGTIDRAMRSFIHAQKSAGKSCSFAFFVGEVEVWVERASTPLEVIGGEMNAALELATRPGRLG